ncbi:MAG TPA: class I adenylate-forming enzyme family protein [Acidimicrobiales bacterium]|nr:class I adenylate-forming enzyme family protein [Acidimicrobiales bacterium]
MKREVSFPSFTPTSGELIKHAAQKYGDKAFVVLENVRMSFTDVERASAELARGLLATGAGKGTRVALLAPNGPDWILGWLAATRIGCVCALLNTYSKARELSYTLRHCDAQMVLMVDGHLGHDYLERMEQVAPSIVGQDNESIFVEELPFLRSVWTWGSMEKRSWNAPVTALHARAGRVPEAIFEAVESEVTPADPMVVIYSSGSTADPKGAIHTHGPAVRHAHNLWQMRDITSDDVLYTPMPLFWVGGMSFTLVAAMHAGATLVFENQFDPPRTLEVIERERVTQVLGWPHMAKALADHPDFKTRDLSSIRTGSAAGAYVLPPELQAEAMRPKANSLGMTETLGPHTFDHRDNVLTDEQAGSFGPSVPGVEHKIVDPLTGEDCKVGESGELWIRGYSLMQGLHKRERADVFTPDGWYRCGDGGYFDEAGHFYFTGRLGDLIKSQGMNITPRDVELALELHPEVVLAFVCGVPVEDNMEKVVAAVALSPGASVTEDELKTFVKDEIASYKVPKHIAVYASQAELPWLDSGKVDRRALAAMLVERFS